MLPLYRLTLLLYGWIIRLGAGFHPKARAWVEGRKQWRQTLRNWARPEGRIGWMHCASLGEFEQGRPVLEEIHRTLPDVQLVLTFFSPSGYEMRKNYPLVKGVFYLPLDSPSNARDFLDLLRPDVVVFVKYEFWYYFWRELQRRRIPTLLISAIFRPGQVFFKPWGGLFRKMLQAPVGLFVQDERSRQLLGSIGVKNAIVAGDTRIDRVLSLVQEDKAWPILEAFCRGSKVLVAGSAWPPDEQLLSSWLAHPSSQSWKCIIAPHEIEEAAILALEKRLPQPALRYTQVGEKKIEDYRILILDTIGMLASAYRYGEVAYVGGGFGKGIHNILEPMAHGLPVLFGPAHQKFREAYLLQEAGAAWSVTNEGAFQSRMVFLSHTENRKEASKKGLDLLNEHQGATRQIVQFLADRLKIP
ncbi:MAG: 3-deoxy-D-manno-octulosonic acid transferase [Saprospirales bacterium]|nr:3-deoxy-D-manno-octulosonic acid transferase [Saprospirales bacterium]MBK8492770.1 3-deoxy-D-manno-octulosonic acid transferase [Saprospirales bacterium]